MFFKCFLFKSLFFFGLILVFALYSKSFLFVCFIGGLVCFRYGYITMCGTFIDGCVERKEWKHIGKWIAVMTFD